ncbi:FAD-dependent oxidoreductase [Pseudonocardia sp. McavD-2-B]|jgi:2-polyprenyl-6-methoxyphenol hydroxylase-like FAD-dependent oxidoreductase|uniref:FAD-dependent oxidoreductase n=1 Tax=Pseudonocardia sp. McavD-2-B TaxID=2954499 RepID=UPI0020985B24|nr:FAD-dependent oxidoreductase [Pseudonocardia sp. McavD-2-B]MCO7194847.1 FAD-dependent oxidoreductase [Pseudonocardia sp. McavD-2-B]
MSERTTCCVVGGGPAGMMLGLLLARAGVEVTVLEKHGDFLRDFRGDTVHPTTLDLLDDLGLGERFAALPQSRVDEVVIPDERGGAQRIGNMSLLRRVGVRHPYVALVPQWDLLNLLAEVAADEPAFHLRLDTRATSLVRENGRVVGVRYATTTAPGEETTGEIRADLTVACDGRHSVLRAGSGLPVTEYDVPFDTWWFRLPRRPEEQRATLRPRIGKGRFAVVIPREGYYQIGYLAPKGTDARLRAAGVEAFRADIADLMPEYADRVDQIASMDEVKHLDVKLNRLRRWHVDGLLCIGDAAHAMSPIGGVGINLAIQDAVAAATLLAAPLQRGTLTERDLGRVRNRRLLPTVLVQGLQRIMHRNIAGPALAGRLDGPPAPLLRLMRAVPAAQIVPAYLVGVGFRPERAPDFARREPVPAG